jgi:DNA invertase Pin-like site-specific DNA recombinase
VSADKPTLCAIYTRKSSEEGLEQSFNSLQAQREACEAYVLSQKHEGWQVLPALYDDGGFSGGNIERPGLKRLLADIASGKVSTVVVYKVDRLTRSLTDFAKIVEAFDAKGVSFVSVTQQFNTTTSMGRLTLNVLLSFAQFEREVTGERIRDKVAASKKKGMWMGGNVPLGYDLKDRNLLINPKEAELVRLIFREYVRLGSVFELYEWLRDRGIRSKSRTATTGRKLGGAILSRGTLYHLLSNPLYIGKTAHKGKLYPGQHEAIIDATLWQQAADRLKGNRVRRKVSRNSSSERLLVGKLFTSEGGRYTPTHAAKKDKRYYYYTLSKDSSPPSGPRRLPAVETEHIVLILIRSLLGNALKLAASVPDLSVRETKLLVSAGKHASVQLADEITSKGAEFIKAVVSRIEISEDCIRIQLARLALQNSLLGRLSEDSAHESYIALECPLEIRRRGGEVRLVLAAQEFERDLQIPTLIRAVARARHWSDLIASGEVSTVRELAQRSGLDRHSVAQKLQCAALSPRFIEQMLSGTLPLELTIAQMSLSSQLDWISQATTIRNI